MKQLTKKLFSSLIIFSIGSLITRGIQFLLLPLYTSCLTPQMYGTVELWAGTAEMLAPVVILGIHESIFRFSVRQGEPQNVFTTGIIIQIFGDVLWSIAILLFWRFTQRECALLLLLLVLFMGLRMTTAQFLRGMGWAKRYTAVGICQAASLAFFQFWLLPSLGGEGYLLAILLSHMAGLFSAAVMGKLWNYWKPRFVWKDAFPSLSRQMLQYSLPMIPAALLWQLMNLSGRYFALWFCGAEQAGLYTAAAKIGAAVRLAVGIFQQVWQYAVSFVKAEGENQAPFFSMVFRLYTGGLFLCGGILLLLLPVIGKFLLKGSFLSAKSYLPLMTVWAVLQGCSAYFSAFYLAEKKTAGLLRSAAICLICFLTAGGFLTPLWGIWGILAAGTAANSTMLFLRAYGSRKWMPLGKSVGGAALLGGFLLVQAVLASLAALEEIPAAVQAPFFVGILLFSVVWCWNGWKKYCRTAVRRSLNK